MNSSVTDDDYDVCLDPDEEDNNCTSHQQQVLVLVVQSIASFLSIAGSSSIIYLIVSDVKKKYKHKNGLCQRIMLGLSIHDILFSADFLISPFLQPSSEEHLVGASGTWRSCAFAGFFFFAFVGSVFYNFFLSAYYYLSIGRNVRDEEITQKYEKGMHMVSIGMWIGMATYVASHQSYVPNEVIRVCAPGAYPARCENEKCTRGQYMPILALLINFVSVMPPLASVILTVQVYRLVTRQLNANERYHVSNYQDAQQLAKKRAVMIQAILYCAAYVNTTIWIMLNYISIAVLGITKEESGTTWIFALGTVGTCMFAMQGFFNFFVYIRPRYTEWRKADPDLSRWSTLRKVYSGDPIPRPHRRQSALELNKNNRSDDKDGSDCDDQFAVVDTSDVFRHHRTQEVSNTTEATAATDPNQRLSTPTVNSTPNWIEGETNSLRNFDDTEARSGRDLAPAKQNRGKKTREQSTEESSFSMDATSTLTISA